MNVDATLSRRIDVHGTEFLRYVPAGPSQGVTRKITKSYFPLAGNMKKYGGAPIALMNG